MQKYHNKLDTVRNGKVIFPAGDFHLVSEVGAWQEVHLKGYRAAMNEKDEQIAKLERDNKVLAALNDGFPLEIIRLERQIATLAERVRELESAMNLFGEDPSWCELLIEKCAEITKQDEQIAALKGELEKWKACDMAKIVEMMKEELNKYSKNGVELALINGRQEDEIATLKKKNERLNNMLAPFMTSENWGHGLKQTIGKEAKSP